MFRSDLKHSMPTLAMLMLQQAYGFPKDSASSPLRTPRVVGRAREARTVDIAVVEVFKCVRVLIFQPRDPFFPTAFFSNPLTLFFYFMPLIFQPVTIFIQCFTLLFQPLPFLFQHPAFPCQPPSFTPITLPALRVRCAPRTSASFLLLCVALPVTTRRAPL